MATTTSNTPTQAPTPISTTGNAPQRLKNACDVCSSFKIRCDKAKPSCGRCAAIGQPCAYSPARRAGRPHRRRRHLEPAQQPDHYHHHHQRQQQQQEQEQQQQQQPLFLQNPAGNNVSGHVQPFDMAAFDWSCDDLEAAGAIGVPSKSTAAPPWPTVRFEAQSPERRDCTSTALALIEGLDGAHPGAAAACRRLLAIMVCPCSGRLSVALLVAAGCVVLMDTVGSERQVGAEQEGLVGGGARAVDDLSGISKVVLAYTERYKGPRMARACEDLVVQSATVLLRSKLRRVVEEAAFQLVP